MTQHTPGPWIQKSQSDKAGDGWTRIINLGAGTPVAKILSIHKNGKREAGDYEVEEANARLIATAPDMLAFIERVAKWGFYGDTIVFERSTAQAVATELLKKVRG